ncbi:hypothetical protein J4E93_002836 [Alternaria ventricosa]|uniref:uncharacterized protein n=1 Tax=Alternaria ventricosa TaxID=1187951 RepID=UPI0020C4424E|nr:uncharacterized protein J4E93_002836 [Alternaria ventricosa]KAI4650480.1 hypothetical protein J4E93_002836 [Alternaria ventricosa]
MDHTIFTPQLKLTRLMAAERGSQEFEWLHQLRSDEKAAFWSIDGIAKTFEDTERFTKYALPVTVKEGETKSYRVSYAVHELLSSPEYEGADRDSIPTRFIGHIGVKSLGDRGLTLRSDILPPSTFEPECLTVELGYSYLPSAWGKGHATSAVKALIEACKKERSFWEPYDKVFLRAIVNSENPASRRVMNKSGLKELGVHIWEGEKMFIAGKWRTRDELYVYGTLVVE